jgi:alkanesulfonate monooxygenase SsuD/methylene tetrahydromethanopterin reductase-like flavin-dependent oxidoreductase (luciferase family)
MGLNLATAFFSPNRDLIREGIGAYREALAAAGVAPSDRKVLSVMQMYCAHDDAQARDGWQYTSNYLKFFAGIDAARPTAAADSQTAVGGASVARMGELTFDFFDSQNLCLIGTPDKLIQKLQWVDEFYNRPDILLLEVAQGGLPPDMVLPTLELFAKEVMPSFDKVGGP